LHGIKAKWLKDWNTARRYFVAQRIVKSNTVKMPTRSGGVEYRVVVT